MFDDITRETLEARFGPQEIAQVSTRPPAEPGGEAPDPDEVVDAALADAKAEALERLSARYTLPVAGDTPATLRRIISNIARYWLHRESSKGEVRNRYQSSISDLNAIAKGELEIVGTEAEVAAWKAADRNPVLAAPQSVLHSTRERVFTDRTLARY